MIALETPYGTGPIELFSRSSPRQGVHNWLDPLGFRGGGIGRRREAEKCWVRLRPAPASSPLLSVSRSSGE
jgi:hypothetical protein